MEVLVGGMQRAVSAATDVICADDEIELAFGRALLSENPQSVLGSEVTVRLTGVRDLAFNKAETVEWKFRVAEFDPLGSSVSLSDVRISDESVADELEAISNQV